jgi:hypothetical protein
VCCTLPAIARSLAADGESISGSAQSAVILSYGADGGAGLIPKQAEDISTKKNVMAVWTRGYCVTRNRNVFFIVGLVERALNNLIGSWRSVREANRGREADKPFLRQVETRIQPSSRSVDLFFVYQGEARTMTVFFDLKDDGDDGLCKKSVCLMMGCHGQSDLFIKAALGALSALGPLHFVACSDSDEPPVLLEGHPMSYLDACRKRLDVPSCV